MEWNGMEWNGMESNNELNTSGSLLLLPNRPNASPFFPYK